MDRESAYELLQARAEQATAASAEAEARKLAEQEAEAARKLAAQEAKLAEREAKAAAQEAEKAQREAGREAKEAQRELERQQHEQQRQMEGITKGAFRFISSRNGQEIVRGLFGGLLGGKKR